MLLKTAVPVY